MLEFNSKLSKENKEKVSSLIEEFVDIYKDFYITKDNLRLFIKDNVSLLFDCLNKGDKILYGEEGIVFVTGFSDNAKRKYLKILTKDENSASKLLEALLWYIDCDLYIKIKKRNFVIKSLINNGFKFFGGRGKEVLYFRKGKINI